MQRGCKASSLYSSCNKVTSIASCHKKHTSQSNPFSKSSTLKSVAMIGGGDKIPSVGTLDKPENLDQLLREDRGDDCTSCRVVGGGAFLGLAAYNYLTGMGHLERQRAAILKSGSMFGMRSRKFGVASISMGLAYLGLWRLFR
ncbi:uncharacterized protein LY79DRAFT_556675 [Colletotrichum navitas]|uniref:Distal membrane-arm assembly complex protein 1-like domain-containing protein n=1 Tax=Colletotrichum navitas TaxID=681940 RepID=A0AAD8PX15_9PEZI|nr:uncharacterized protein LY79DRAFT_556675 [Colletotrichum navitas]KAK1589678.1 hypothetical protein LY79DRAFT_556675 [Colletotrichum navitas]